MDTTPASLLERLRLTADQEATRVAWGRFVELYTPLLYYWARRAGLQEQDAADLVQEVFVVLVRKLPEFSYDRHKSFRGWLRTVLLNKWRDARRRAAGRPAEEPMDTHGADLADLATGEDPAALEDEEYRQIVVARALLLMQTDFQPVTWQAFWQHVVDGQPALEVAARFGIRVASVYSAKSRVLRRLRHELAGLLD